MKQSILTNGLLVGNAIALLILLWASYHQFGLLLFGSTKEQPALRTIEPQPLHLSERLQGSGKRNPFDAGAAHWKLADAQSGDKKELQGILLLPGVRAAVTDSGIVRPGDNMNGGKVSAIKKDRLVIQQENQDQEMKLRSAQRPTLQTLNKAQAPGKEKK